MTLIVHTLAQREYDEIVSALEDASITAGERYEAAVKEALLDVLENPFHFHFANRYRRHRRANIKKFNRHFIYTVDEQSGIILIVAFKHDRQHPDHGLDRELT